ncbi:predicted protein [Naegleria gruberi]|uniref:Predicted protein n=1 Tax=Naegleria gruberi TaxID=5762 RepID=D2VPI5_NAEGR|nr:uncharacterized protein NAEGRDRAFT_70872 [Naegleria gruberi]EFC41216.1 predicted protein [Naegleria gruberi]|eukprot:XP_002673960.1 predicted protein [Naegleria gruberi strain NEG-M]
MGKKKSVISTTSATTTNNKTTEKKSKKSSTSEASSSKGSSSSSTTTAATNDQKKVIVPLTWVPLSVGQVIIPSQTKDEPNNGADITIEVKSRLVKNLDNYPSDCLFRTHQYDFTLTPTKELLEWAKIDYGFYSKIKLFMLISSEQDLTENYDNGEWTECFSSESRPVITDSHTEDYENGVWKITLYWQNAKVFKFKPSAKFRFEIDVYRACTDRDVMKKVATKISSPFRLLSKPEVYLKSLAKTKNKRKGSSITNDEEEEDEEDDTDSHSVATSSSSNSKKKVKISPNAVKNNLSIPTLKNTMKNSSSATAAVSKPSGSSTITTTTTVINLLDESRDEIVLDEGGASSPILVKSSNFPSSDDFNTNDIESNTVQSPIITTNKNYEYIQSSPPPFLTPPLSPLPQSRILSSQENGLFPLIDGPITSQETSSSNPFNTSDIFFNSTNRDEGPSSSLGSLFSSSQ